MSAPVMEEMPERVLDPERLGDHVDRLFRAAWALCRSREDAEDLVQETYARVLARPRLLRSDDELGYLLRVLRNTFISGHRAAARRPPAAAVDFETLDLPDRVFPEPAVAAQTREVFIAIDALPGEFRDVLVAVDVVGLSYREAAKALRVRAGTIASRLFRARDQVAKSLSSPRIDQWRQNPGNKSGLRASLDGSDQITPHIPIVRNVRARKGHQMSSQQATASRRTRSKRAVRKPPLVATAVAMLAALAIAAAGCGSGYSSSPAPAASASPAAPSSSTAIPQNNGGDHDADNNGGPSDGDGRI